MAEGLKIVNSLYERIISRFQESEQAIDSGILFQSLCSVFLILLDDKVLAEKVIDYLKE